MRKSEVKAELIFQIREEGAKLQQAKLASKKKNNKKR